MPTPIERFNEHYGEEWETGREAWAADPKAVEAFLESAPASSDDYLHVLAGLLLTELPRDGRFRRPAVQLLSSPDSFARKLAAKSLRSHGEPADCPALLAQARSDPDERVREECLESYVVLAEEIDEREVEEVFTELDCMNRSFVVLAIAQREEQHHLLSLVQRESARCDHDVDAQMRFSLARWLLGEDAAGEDLMTLGLNDDAEPVLFFNLLDWFDEEMGRNPGRASPGLRRVVEETIKQRPSLADELARTVEACRRLAP